MKYFEEAMRDFDLALKKNQNDEHLVFKLHNELGVL
jgi:hypothetical protein